MLCNGKVLAINTWFNKLKLQFGLDILEEDLGGYMWYQRGLKTMLCECMDTVGLGCVWATEHEPNHLCATHL